MPATSPAQGTALRCLNAHENPYIREAISLVVKEFWPGWQVRETDSEAAFVAVMRDEACDLVILDYHLATRESFRMLDVIRLAGATAPAIIVSDYVEAVVMARALKRGVRGFIDEGSLYTDLKPAIERILSGEVFISVFR